MSIPLATTTIAVLRPVAGTGTEEVVDPWAEKDPAKVDPSDFTTVATGVRATIAVRGGQATIGDGQKTLYHLLSDPTDLRHHDRVKDETSGRVYEVEWCVNNPAVMGLLASTQAGLTDVAGLGQDED